MSPVKNICSFAVQKPSKKKRWRKIKPYGLGVHTSGRGIVERALRKEVVPIELALEWYRSKGSVHYTVDYDGCIYQMLDDDRRGAHIGISFTDRLKYLSGRWKKEVKWLPLRCWRARWSGYKSPQHLYPTHSPNGCYIGVEMIPLITPDPSTGLWFTTAQHRAIGLLYKDLCERHGWNDHRSRLVGHEDISAYTRWDNKGGWDPGALRLNPRFSWKLTGVRD